MKIRSNGRDHMTKITAIPIYGKSHIIVSTPEPQIR